MKLPTKSCNIMQQRRSKLIHEYACKHSRAWRWLIIFARLTKVTCFPRLTLAGDFFLSFHWLKFSRAWRRLLIFVRLTLHVFPRLSLAEGFLFEFLLAYVFSRLAKVPCFLVPAQASSFCFEFWFFVFIVISHIIFPSFAYLFQTM